MKSSKLMIAVALLVLVVPAVAQSVAVQATVPFNFNVGAQAMPAGEYRVTFDGREQMWISRVGIGGATTALTNATGGGQTQGWPPKLIFKRYGDHYFLSEVWTGGTHYGRQLMISSTERGYARAAKSQPSTVVARRLSNK
jgi:hypothetical protein